MRARRDAFSFVLVAALFVLAADLAWAQQRPSRERLEEYACAAADDRGESYRPIFCDGRCDCLVNEDLSASVSCGQLAPGGSIEISGVVLVDAICGGGCTVSAAACFSNADCGGGGGDYCSFGIPELGGGACVVDGFTCSDDSDCDQSKGFTCENLAFIGDTCVAGFCFSAGVCETGVQGPLSFSRTIGFAPLGDARPVSCDTGGNISSTDVAECIAQVEAHLGAGACAICGDGNLDVGEQCDDGNLDPGDGCAPNCTTE